MMWGLLDAEEKSRVTDRVAEVQLQQFNGCFSHPDTIILRNILLHLLEQDQDTKAGTSDIRMDPIV